MKTLQKFKKKMRDIQKESSFKLIPNSRDKNNIRLNLLFW